MKSLLTFGMFITCLMLYAQNHRDNNWIFSDINGAVVVNFSNGSPTVETVDIPIVFEGASAQISDKNGNLLFYTNGCSV